MRATSLGPVVLTMTCIGVLAGCATHPAPATPAGPSALPQKKASAPTASAKSSGSIPFAGDGARDTPSDLDSGSGDRGTDLGFDIPNLEVLDPNLHASLAILRIGSEPKANQLLSVFTGMRNKTGQKLSLEVQTIYKDRLGNPLNDGTWVPMTLNPHQETEYRSASLSVDAVDFVVRIRRTPAPN